LRTVRPERSHTACDTYYFCTSAMKNKVYVKLKRQKTHQIAEG
jgi:YHS domain-containing protein